MCIFTKACSQINGHVLHHAHPCPDSMPGCLSPHHALFQPSHSHPCSRVRPLQHTYKRADMRAMPLPPSPSFLLSHAVIPDPLLYAHPCVALWSHPPSPCWDLVIVHVLYMPALGGCGGVGSPRRRHVGIQARSIDFPPTMPSVASRTCTHLPPSSTRLNCPF